MASTVPVTNTWSPASCTACRLEIDREPLQQERLANSGRGSALCAHRVQAVQPHTGSATIFQFEAQVHVAKFQLQRVEQKRDRKRGAAATSRLQRL